MATDGTIGHQDEEDPGTWGSLNEEAHMARAEDWLRKAELVIVVVVAVLLVLGYLVAG